MASSALATRLGIALHRLGIPEQKLDQPHQAIMEARPCCCSTAAALTRRHCNKGCFGKVLKASASCPKIHRTDPARGSVDLSQQVAVPPVAVTCPAAG